MIARQQQLEIEEVSVEQWFAWMRSNWFQGEHVAIIGPTGSGKTTIAQILLEIRTYVVVLAVKRTDDTLEQFKSGAHGLSKYKVISTWPPKYPNVRVVFWARPKELGVTNDQQERLRNVVNKLYLQGGWTIFFDDAGYITGYLHMGGELGIMLNQGRSDNLTVVAAMTQPKSMVARLPSETFKQCRHQLIFKFDNEDEVKAIAAIAGINWHRLLEIMAQLRDHDFIYKGKGRLVLVRNNL